MPKRARPKPLEEGSLKNIYEWFFKPLATQYAEEGQNAIAFLEELLRPDLRAITQWRGSKWFDMPGLHYQAGGVKVQGTGYRRVRPGTLLMARADEREDTVDVEFMGGPGQKELCFCLTKLQWEWVKLHIKPEVYDASKPGHRNTMRGARVRRVDEDQEQEGPREKGTLRSCA